MRSIMKLKEEKTNKILGKYSLKRKKKRNLIFVKAVWKYIEFRNVKKEGRNEEQKKANIPKNGICTNGRCINRVFASLERHVLPINVIELARTS